MRPMRNGRTLSIMLGPSIADPAYQIPIYEYDAAANRKTPEGVMPPVVRHTGWKAHLITWLIKKLLPYPEGLYK